MEALDESESVERSAVTPVRARPPEPATRDSRTSAPPPPRASAPPQLETRQQPVVPMTPSNHAAVSARADLDRRSDERGKLMAVLLGMAIGAVLYGITIVVILVMRG